MHDYIHSCLLKPGDNNDGRKNEVNGAARVAQTRDRRKKAVAKFESEKYV